MQTAVITFPGSNCDRDMYETVEKLSGKKTHRVWHADTSLPDGLDFIALPGGFSYGDYLRSGAIGARSPIMQEVVKAAKRGVYVLGVCNGFQILTESGLLPGTLLRNSGLKFLCKQVTLEVVNSDSAFTKNYGKGKELNIPIAHHDGNYFADKETLAKLASEDRIAFKYKNNPNGSQLDIAGVLSENKRVLGMMPHPERACDEIVAGVDGVGLFEGLFESR